MIYFNRLCKHSQSNTNIIQNGPFGPFVENMLCSVVKYMYLWNQQTKWFNLIKHLNAIHKYLYGIAIIGPFHGMNKCVRRWWLLRKFNFCEQIFIIKSSSKQFNFNNVERKKKNLHFLFCSIFFSERKKGHKINKGMFREIREAIRQNTKNLTAFF